jgi:HlyD family secretion protein
MKLPRLLRNPRVLAMAGFVLLLLLVALWPERMEVDTGPVERGPLQVTVDEEGETRVRDRFVVSSPVTGRVRRIDLEPGDRVRKGQVLATLVPAPLDPRSRAEAGQAAEAAAATVGQARAERQRAEAALKLARSELQRLRALAREDIVSAQALEAQETAVRSAEDSLRAADFAVATASHQRDMARARLMEGAAGTAAGPLEVRSPLDAFVLKRYRESESVVPAGEPLLELGDPDALEVVSDLLSTDAVKVRPGQPVWIEQWGGERPLRGRVRLVEPSGFMKVSALGVEEQRVNVVIDFEDPPAARPALGDGYRVEVRVVVWEAQDALKVPTSALFRRGDKWAVFLADGGRARIREVDVGRRNGLTAQVLQGLEPGARVIVHPPDTLADGTRIKLRG